MGGVGFKTCSKCGKTLPLTDFYRNKNCRDGHSSACKDCVDKGIKESKQHKKDLLTLKIADFTDQALFDELKKRGYGGQLVYTKKICI